METSVNILILLLLNFVSTADILILQPFGSRSHRQAVTPIAIQLGLRGHQVTFVSTYKSESSLPPNVTEITYPQFETNFQYLQSIIIDIAKNGWTTDIFSRYYQIHSELCRQFYQSNLLQNWISSKRKFKVVMADVAMNECILPLWRHVGESLILINTCQLSPLIVKTMSIPTPYSHIPIPLLPYTHHMTFTQRFVNTIYWLITDYIIQLSQTTFHKHVIIPYFPNTKPYFETMKNVSLVLVNDDPVLSPPRPYLPTVISIGGIQCRNAKPLPEGDLKTFVDDSGDAGFILLSFGSIIDGNLLSQDLIRLFIEAFSKIKQRVVWKFEKIIADLPENILTIEWVPQQDLLGHPKIQLFISHGGLQGLQEAIFHAVPQICFPMTTDQPNLVAAAEDHGIAIKLDPKSVTVDQLISAINKATKNKEMQYRVAHLSKIFRDRIKNPLSQAVYWIEYVIKYNGAHHLQSAATELNFFQYYLLDVFSIIILVFIVVLFVLYFILKNFILFVFNRMYLSLSCSAFKFKKL